MEGFLFCDSISKTIIGEKDIFIYGVGLMGKALMECLKRNPYNKVINGFIVQNSDDNPREIDGVRICDVKSSSADKSALVLIALHEKNLEMARDVLKAEGFRRVLEVSFDSDAWNHIRGNYYYANSILEENVCWNTTVGPKCEVFVACSGNDHFVMDSSNACLSEKPIRVGGCFSNEHRLSFSDDVGDNISAKNSKYCELTALYWVWKHRKADYLGLSHYRRRFITDIVSQGEELIDVDMVVTVPILNLEGVRNQYGRDHTLTDWDTMMEIIEEKHPDYYDVAISVQERKYYYGYNMFVAKYDVFCKYCEWLFDILFECERRIGDKEDPYQNRYVGFLAERLLSVFIRKNNLKVGIAEKHFFS